MPGDAFELTLKAVNIVLIKQSILITKQKELFTVNLAFFFKAQHFSFGLMYFPLFFFFKFDRSCMIHCCFQMLKLGI